MPASAITDPSGARKTNRATWSDSKLCSDITVTAHGPEARQDLWNSDETAASLPESNWATLAVPRYCLTYCGLATPDERMHWPDSKQARGRVRWCAPSRPHYWCL